MTRQRYVYPTAEIPHKWAHQTQQRARNPQGNLFFEGATIYSYRTNWPLARIYTRRDGARLVLSNSDKYSNTTAQHQHAVNRAASHLDSIAVPIVVLNMEHVPGTRAEITREQARTHAENLAYLQKVAADHLAAAQRAMTERAVTWRRRVAFGALTDCGRYMGFFGIRRKAPTIPAAEWAAAEARAHRIEHPDPASADKRERASAQRKARMQERDAYMSEQRLSLRRAKQTRDFYRVGAARSSWRLGDVWGYDFEALRSSGVLLRVHGDDIETSYGARVPLAAAPMVWNLVERARADGGRMFLKALHRVQIGDYGVDSIDADGTLHAGCHIIPYSELALMARTLGLAS